MTSAPCTCARVLLSGIVFGGCGCGRDWPGLFWWKEQKRASCQWLSVLSIKGAMCPRQKGFLCPRAMQLWGLGTLPCPLLQSSLNGQNSVSYLCNVTLSFPKKKTAVVDVLMAFVELKRVMCLHIFHFCLYKCSNMGGWSGTTTSVKCIFLCREGSFICLSPVENSTEQWKPWNGVFPNNTHRDP